MLHTISSTINMGKKEKSEVGTEVGEGIKKTRNPTHIWPYLPVSGILFKSFLNFTPDTRPLRLLKMIYNTKRSWDKQSEGVNIRLKADSEL